jgi:hemolysin III
VPHPPIKARLKVLDHCAIYLLIAGSYTPFALVGLKGHGGHLLLAAAWGLAALGIVFKLFYTGRFKLLSTGLYLAMGWLVVFAIKPLWAALPGSTLAWLFAGGAAYSLGTAFYLSRRAYAHAVWHAFVLVAQSFLPALMTPAHCSCFASSAVADIATDAAPIASRLVIAACNRFEFLIAVTPVV